MCQRILPHTQDKDHQDNMFIYHVKNDSDFEIGPKSKINSTYQNVELAWGHIIRNDETKIAHLVSPDGKLAHKINDSMFNKFARICEHKDYPVATIADIRKVILSMPSMSTERRNMIFDAIDENSRYQNALE